MQKIKVKKIGDYVLLEQIGKGNFATVYKGQYFDKQKPKNIFAIKQILLQKGSPMEKTAQMLYKREGKNLLKVRHESFIQIYDAFTTESSIYFVMEYAGGGDLSAYLRQNYPLSEEKIQSFSRQLAQGMRVLFDNKILHRDLKPSNLLLSDQSEMPSIKIADLGLSKQAEVEVEMHTYAGTQNYMAPEVLTRCPYNYKADL